MADACHPSYLGIRQKDYSFEASVGVEFEPANENECAGLVLLQNHPNHISVEIVLKDGKKTLQVKRCVKGEEKVTSSIPVKKGLIEIKLKASEQLAKAYAVIDDKHILLEEGIDLLPYTYQQAGGFVGCIIGMYTSSNGKESSNHADFAWLSVDNGI